MIIDDLQNYESENDSSLLANCYTFEMLYDTSW